MHRPHGRDYWREIPARLREPSGTTTRDADDSVRVATLVDAIEAATALARLKTFAPPGFRSPFARSRSSSGATPNEPHLGPTLDALPSLASAIAAVRTLDAPREAARPAVRLDAKARELASQAERNAREAARRLRGRWEEWLRIAAATLVVPDSTHLSSSAQSATPWMTPAQIELAREAGYAHAVDPFALAKDDRLQAAALLRAHRAHVAARIAEVFRAGSSSELRGLVSMRSVDRWTRFVELADAIDATKQRRFGLAVSWDPLPEPSAGAPSRTNPPKCVFGALRICAPTDPACAMSFELPDRRTTERLRDHIARLRAFSGDRLTLVHRLGRECRHVDWGSCALGWSTAGKLVWAGRPARDEGPDIAESLQRSGFRSVWFAADILGAPD
jgi:hypothetical protein